MRSLVIICMMGMSTLIQAQTQTERANLLLEGRITDANNGRVKHAFVQIQFKNGKRKVVDCLSDGSFSLMLDYDDRYTLSFHAKKHQPKKIEVITKFVPEEGREYGHEFSGFIVQLNRNKNPLLPIEAGSIYYDPKLDIFTFER